MAINSLNFSFEIGKKEKHKIVWEFRYGLFAIGPIINIMVDKKIIYKSGILIPGRREFIFKVGMKEKHEVKMKWRIPLFYPVFGQLKNEIYVDGEYYNKYEI